MRVEVQKLPPGEPVIFQDQYRVQCTFIGPDEQEWSVIMLDAPDSFDVVIHAPNSERECVWSLVKDETYYVEEDNGEEDR